MSEGGFEGAPVSTFMRDRTRPGPIRPGSWSVTVGAMALFVMALLAVMAAAALQSRSRAVAEAERATQDAARLLEAQVAYVLDVGATILALQAAIVNERTIADERFRETFGRDLRSLLADKPYVFRAFVVDANGEVIAGTLDPLPRLNVIRRSYFHLHASGQNGPILTTRVRSQASGEPIMVLSRRIDGEKGGFLAVGIVSFNLDALREIFRSLAPAEFGSVFQLIGEEMTILIDVSPPPDRTGARLDVGEAEKPFAPASSLHASSDEEERIWVSRKVGAFPLHVRVGTSLPVVIGRWREDLASYALGSGIAVVALTVLAGFVVVYGRREEIAARALRDLNAELERRVVERTAELQNLAAQLGASLEEKDVLFREIHHRVKNNLQVVASMVRFSSAKVSDPGARAVFSEIARRIRAIGLVHQTIYEQEAASRVPLERYLVQLAELEGEVYGAAERGVLIEVRSTGDIDLNNAVSVGLIVSELIANALKHAFPVDRGGRITVTVERLEGLCRILVVDDGVGFPPDTSDGTGLGIIRSVAAQLNAAVTIEREGGTRVELNFPL